MVGCHVELHVQNYSSNAVTINPDDISQSNYAFVGNGFDHQLSYNFPSNYEIIGRYSTQKSRRGY
jgi:hypothetical protein